MYLYLYDASLTDRKYAGMLAQVETRLTDYGLQGRIGRLGPLKSAKELVKSAIKAGVKTVVAVGNDRTLTETVNASVNTDLTVGFIPIGKPNEIANLMGLPEGGEAVVILAARKIELVDLGKINGYYFLTSAKVKNGEAVRLICDERYTVQPMPGANITIANLVQGARCQDGFLEATIEETRSTWWRRNKKPTKSVIPLRQGTISVSGEGTMIAENSYTIKLPATIEVVPNILKLIVGRQRQF